MMREIRLMIAGPGVALAGGLVAPAVAQGWGMMIDNPRLKLGDVKEKDADTITAEVVTKDKDALVQKFAFNRHNGRYQPE